MLGILFLISISTAASLSNCLYLKYLIVFKYVFLHKIIFLGKENKGLCHNEDLKCPNSKGKYIQIFLGKNSAGNKKGKWMNLVIQIQGVPRNMTIGEWF